uniref:TNFAIP3-interacting protein 1 n=1 Tax=Strix occidentalis caurina TaxID=311401 RepID=A0A8D0F3V3_STROC
MRWHLLDNQVLAPQPSASPVLAPRHSGWALVLAASPCQLAHGRSRPCCAPHTPSHGSFGTRLICPEREFCNDLEQPPNEDANLLPQLQQLESTLSGCAKEASKDQVFVRMGYMASELKRLASKVHKNEQRTSFLQTLCETLHSENKELRTKLERDLEQRNQALEKLSLFQYDQQDFSGSEGDGGGRGRGIGSSLAGLGHSLRKSPEGPPVRVQQSGATVEKAPGRGELEAKEKKVKILEHQRRELLEVNKQWDQHFRAMKQKYEQKVTDLHQELAEARRALTELESEREQKQRDFDRKLLLAKSRIETEEAEKERLAMEVRDLQQRMRFLQEQLAPVTRQREYQEKEIQRLNKALEEALNVQASPPPIFASTMEPVGKVPQQELLTQNELLKQQVKIFEEDFQRERSDRERMNEEKEELKQQLEKLQKQLVLSNNQVSSAGCHQHSRSPMSTLGVSEVVIPVSQPPYPSRSRDRKARAVVLLLLVPARASPFTCLFLLPLSWGSDGGEQCRHSCRALQQPSPTDTGSVGWALH